MNAAYLSNRVISKTIRAMIRAYGERDTFNRIVTGAYSTSANGSNRALRNFNAVTMHIDRSNQYL